MEYRNICMGCMGDKGQAELCPHCGYIEGTEPPNGQYLTPRTMLAGKYLIGRGLGHGGFGITYLAYDIVLKRKLAIKEYLPQDCATRAVGQSTVMPFSGEDKQEQFEYGVDKFLEEARTLAQFDGHPNIVGVRDFFKDNGTAYLVMNFLSGETLKEYLRRHDRALGYQQALKIMAPVMDALRTVHAAGVLHRDVSPDNIFLTNGGQVKLIDFGAARQPRDGQRSISVILKPGYAPEEQYRSRGKQGPWTDVYATAATFYRSITGKVPPESLDRLDQDTLIPPSQMGVRIPPEAEAALLRAMAVRAADRYQTIQAFKDALMEEGGAQQRPAQAARPTPPPAQRAEQRADTPPRQTPPRPPAQRPPPKRQARQDAYVDPSTYPLQYRKEKGVRIGIVVALLIVLIVVAAVLALVYWMQSEADKLTNRTSDPPAITLSPPPTAVTSQDGATLTATPAGADEDTPEPTAEPTPLPASMTSGKSASRAIGEYVPASKMLITLVNKGVTQTRLTSSVADGVGAHILVCEANLNSARTEADTVYAYFYDSRGNIGYAPLEDQANASVFLPESCVVGQTTWSLEGKAQEVIAVDHTATLGGTTYRDCIVVREGADGSYVYKFYVPGVGLHTIRDSLEEDVEGSFRVTGQESTTLDLFDLVPGAG